MAKASVGQVEQLVSLLEEGYRSQAWHGPNLRGALRGVSPALAAWRSEPGRHNIWELTLHAAYWKYAVRRRLTGEKRGGFALPGSNWFRRPEHETEAAWRGDLRLLASEHRRLLDVAGTLKDRDLARAARPGKTRCDVLLRGVASHDIYHAGQIQMLKRLAPGRLSRP